MRLLFCAPYPLRFRVEIATTGSVHYYQFDCLDDRPLLQIVILFLSQHRKTKNYFRFNRKWSFLTQRFDRFHRFQTIRFLLLFHLCNIFVGRIFEIWLTSDGYHLTFSQQFQMRPECVARINGNFFLKFLFFGGKMFFFSI